MRAFVWLEVYQKLPTDFGASEGEMDPAFEGAMWAIKNGLEGERRMM